MKHVKGTCCGAVCTTYLLGEYLNSEDQKNANAEDFDREKVLQADCWEYVKINVNPYGQPICASNPFKIWKYLTADIYKSQNENVQKYVMDKLEPLFVCPVVELNGDDLNNHPLSDLMGLMMGDAGMPDLDLNGYTSSDIQLEDNDYLLGVFGSQERREKVKLEDASELHYILLHREGNKLEYINPHENTWKTWKEFTDEPTLEGDCNLESNFQLTDEWWWKDFGLIIKKMQNEQ